MGLLYHAPVPGPPEVNDLRSSIMTRRLALVIAVVVGVWHALQGPDFEWVSDVPPKVVGAFNLSAPQITSPDVPAHFFFYVQPWFPQYIAEGVVLGVLVFLGIAALRVAWRSFNSPRVD
jgi:hypothetical protein